MSEQPDLSYAIGLPPEQAIKYFEAKGYKITWNWYEMWQDAHAEAFTVVKVSRLDLLQDIRKTVDSAIADGTTFDKFKDDLTPLLKAKAGGAKTRSPGRNLAARTRPAHAALNGKVFRHDDVFWKTHFPPLPRVIGE